MLWLALLLLADADLPAEIRRFVDVLAVVEEHAADSTPSSKLFYEGAIPGMLRRLDPHTIFFDPEQFEQLRQMETSTRKGFGSVVSLLPGRVIVLQTLPGTPSAKAGIAAGDEIVALNNIPLAYLDVEQLVQLLSESRLRPVNLDVRRPGNARLLQFVLTPEEMQSPSVDRAFHVSPGVGYVRVNSFDEKTGQELKAAIDKLGGANLRGLLLDLRDNPGGVLGSAVNAASLFLEPGTTLLSVRGRSVPREEIKVPEAAAPYSFRIAVLVNGKSASGSEIVAAAVQSHKRGVVVGQPTYGKGLVQAVMPLSAGTALALTTAYYYTPDGRSIQRQLSEGQLAGNGQAGAGGVQPDLIVWPERPTRLRAVLEATASFTNFATFYIQKHPAIAGNFEIDPKVLDEYQLFLSERNIRPGLDEWSQEREWIRSRLKQEILNQALGVEKGDELEIQRDPVVRRALEALA